MSDFSNGNVPGFQTKQETQEGQVTWSGRQGQDLTATRKVVIDASATDDGNSPHTTTLRAGLVLAMKDSDGKVYPYNSGANDGRQIALGILEQPQEMLEDGVATDRFTQMLVQGLARENRLYGLDVRAKSQLAGRFLFDRDLNSAAGSLMQPRGAYRISGDHTLTKAEHGLLMIATSAVAFTLPDKENGLAFRLLQSTY